MRAKVSRILLCSQRFADRTFYPALLLVLAIVDSFIFVIPMDGILISSSMLRPKRWMILALCVAIGSTFGVMVLAYFVEFFGLPWVLQLYPGIDQSSIWDWSVRLFENYGLLLVFGVALLPIVQQPAVILAALAGTPLTHLTVTILVGRLIKYLVLAYISSHAPKHLRSIWGI